MHIFTHCSSVLFLGYSYLLYVHNTLIITVHLTLILTLTTILLITVVRAVVVIVAPPDGRYTPFVVALKLSILTLIRRWRKNKQTINNKQKVGGGGSVQMDQRQTDMVE